LMTRRPSLAPTRRVTVELPHPLLPEMAILALLDVA
jgi:hypothetical protein